MELPCFDRSVLNWINLFHIRIVISFIAKLWYCLGFETFVILLDFQKSRYTCNIKPITFWSLKLLLFFQLFTQK